MTDINLDAMKLAIELSQNCISENAAEGKTSPKVGAVLVRNGEIIGSAYRGEMRLGEHAEYTLLERKLRDEDLSNSTLFTTLEPCTLRGRGKIPCADRIIARSIPKVVVGMIDPNPRIGSTGLRRLKDRSIVIDFFPATLRNEIALLNASFLVFIEMIRKTLR